MQSPAPQIAGPIAQLQDGGGTWLSKTTSEKELGIVVDHKLNMSQQCDVATKKANAILGCINRSIVSKSCKVLVPSIQHWLGFTLSIVSSSEHHTSRRMLTNWNKFRGGRQR